MNINTLVNELPDYVTGDLPIVLYKNALRRDAEGKESYYGKVLTRKSLSQTDIANDLVVTGNNRSLAAAEIVTIWNTINSAIIDRVANGCTVDTGLGTFYAKVVGSFDSANEQFSRDKHSIDMGFRASKRVLTLFNSLKVLISLGHTATPEITTVTDLESGRTDTLTVGGFLNIDGTNLSVAGEDEAVGLYFKNSLDSTKDVKLSAKKLGVNTPSKLACVVPPLESGTYQIKIVTQYSKSKTLRKSPIESTLSAPLTVA